MNSQGCFHCLHHTGNNVLLRCCQCGGWMHNPTKNLTGTATTGNYRLGAEHLPAGAYWAEILSARQA